MRLPEIELVLLVERLICIKAPNPIGNIRVHGLMGPPPILGGAKTLQMLPDADQSTSLPGLRNILGCGATNKGARGHCEGGPFFCQAPGDRRPVL